VNFSAALLYLDEIGRLDKIFFEAWTPAFTGVTG